MPVPVALQALAYILTSVAAVDALATKPPENKLQGTASPGGGGTQSQAAQVFSAGQPQPLAQLPQAVQPPMDPNITAQTNALAMQTPPPSLVGQSIIDNAIGAGKPLNVPNSPMMPQTPPPEVGGIGPFLAGLNNAAGAMSAMAPLLGLGPEPQRGLAMAGAAGGGAGQNIFQLPQRNTLAQILASLPRTYHG